MPPPPGLQGDRLGRLGLAVGADVVLMPQGRLGVFPLHAARPDGPGVGCFLDHWTVRYAPSGEALRSTRMRPVTHSPTLLAAVDPTGRLAGAPAEVAAIARRFPAEAVRVLWDAEAVEEPSSTPPPTARTSISHRTPSTAGRTRWRHGLHMYGGTSFDVAEVVARMDLAGARLATLSACETGISEYAIQPDEYVGLPAGFLEAGAQGGGEQPLGGERHPDHAPTPLPWAVRARSSVAAPSRPLRAA